MIGLAALLLVACCLVVVATKRRQPPPQEIDPEDTSRAAVELYAIRSRLDVAWTHTELRRETTRVRRLIAEELDDA